MSEWAATCEFRWFVHPDWTMTFQQKFESEWHPFVEWRDVPIECPNPTGGGDVSYVIRAAVSDGPRYTLTDLGNSYRRAMTNKLNGEVKAGEGGNNG